MNYLITIFKLSLLIACFTYGVVVGVYKFFPYQVLQDVKCKLNNTCSVSPVFQNQLKFDKPDYDGSWVPVVQTQTGLELTEITPDEEILNSFIFSWVRIEDDNIEQASALKFKDGSIYYINRQDPQILSQLGLSDENLPAKAGVRAVFDFQGQTLAYVAYVEENCVTAKLVSLGTNETLLDLGCIDVDEANLDLVGGGHLVLNENEFLIAIGTGTAHTVGNQYNQNAQHDESYWGKILKFSFVEGSHKVSVYSKGHRNPQGMFARKGKIYAVEHGPRGGDEINEISEANNYGWPKQSLGSETDGTPINKSTEDIPNYVDPLYAFIPSIGISDINECPQSYSNYYQPYKCLAVSSMRAGAIFFLVFNDNRILFTERMDFESRIRKIVIDGDRVIAVTDYEGVIVGEMRPIY